MSTCNYISNTINEIIEILEKNNYRKKRYNKDVEWFKERKNTFKDSIIRIAIMGITSSGKSTLVNALLGEKILPMAIKPSSSIITTVSKGENRQAIIYFRDKEPQILTGSSLNDKVIGEYADESKNPNNKLNVTQIDITTPNFLLNENIHIIDSPGLDACDLENHEKLTLEILLPTIDICIFLTTVKANSDEISAEKIKIVNEKGKQIILVQNMIDSVEEKLGKNGVIEEDKSVILKKHKKRAENLLRQGTNNKEGFEIIQISALNGLKGIVNKEKEVYKSSNMEGFINAIENCIKNVIPKINEQRKVSLSDRINQIITTDKEISNGIDLKTIEKLMKVRTEDIDDLVYNFKNSKEEISLKIKAIEDVISDLTDEIRSSSSEEIESYLNIVDKINNKNLYIESDILNIVKKCEDKKNELYRKLNLDMRLNYSLPNLESKNISVKHKYEERSMLFKKEGVLNKGKRLLSNIFDKDWGYKEVGYGEKVVDKDATMDMAKDICNQNKIKYINILMEWSTQYNNAINIFYNEVSKRVLEYEEKKKQNIEIYDIEDVTKNLKLVMDKLRKSEREGKYEAAITIDEHKENLSYSISNSQYNLYTLSNEIIEKNHLLVGSYIKEKGIEKISVKVNEIIWTWDMDSCVDFVSRIFGIHLNQQECGLIEKEGLYIINNMVIVYELCKNKLNFYADLKQIKEKPYNMFVIFNGIQIGNSKKQILESMSLNYFIRNNDKLMINLVVDSCKASINANNLKELLLNVNILKDNIISKFDNVKEGYILVNSKNPLYNMALIEGQENDEFLISDYRYLKEKLFRNFLSRGEEEKETLEEILIYFLNSPKSKGV
jgi:GTPase Era involved in 16S rRNA processing